jgi:3',5'-cyclic AMP phosphodiesterase CpdA
MRRVMHISDLHFGRVDPAVVEKLHALICRCAPHVLAVSGDLTQRARSREFAEAAAFLKALPFPQVVVPGNHDVPLHNVAARWLRPLDKYRRHISENLEPFFADDEIAVVGINTARALTWKGGRINKAQVERGCERLDSAGPERARIVVTHHPFDLPEGHSRRHLLGRAHMAMAGFARSQVDVFLAGHLHVGHIGGTARYNIEGYAALVVQAATASSTRSRGEPNSCNLLHVSGGAISIERLTWHAAHGDFRSSAVEHFRRTPEGWSGI